MISRVQALRGPFRKVVQLGHAVIWRGRLRSYADAVLECGHRVDARAKLGEHPLKVRCRHCRDLALEAQQRAVEALRERVTRRVAPVAPVAPAASASAPSDPTTVTIVELAGAGFTVGELEDLLAAGKLVATSNTGVYRATKAVRSKLLAREKK